MRRLLAAALIPLLLAVVAACGKDKTPAPFAGCDKIPTGAATAAGLPDLTLPCFSGDTRIRLRDLRGPAVINMWASWCGPCRAEMPLMQQLADRAGGRLTVIGVDTGDSRDAGAGFATDRGVSMPTLFDDDKNLLNALTKITLPVTVFVDPDGRVYVHALPLDAAGLTQQVREHTGVTVAG